jgi:hypothetical protein
MDRPDGGRSGIQYGDESAVAYRQGSVGVHFIVFVLKNFQFININYAIVYECFNGYFRDDMKEDIKSVICACAAPIRETVDSNFCFRSGNMAFYCTVQFSANCRETNLSKN